MLKTLIHAPLSFFVATDTGVVTNLFSQDLNMVDTELPNSFLNTIHSVSRFYPPSYNTKYRELGLLKLPLRPGILTLRKPGLTGRRPSSRDAYCVSLSGNQLSISCSTAICLAEILLEDVPPVETIGP